MKKYEHRRNVHRMRSLQRSHKANATFTDNYFELFCCFVLCREVFLCCVNPQWREVKTKVFEFVTLFNPQKGIILLRRQKVKPLHSRCGHTKSSWNFLLKLKQTIKADLLFCGLLHSFTARLLARSRFSTSPNQMIKFYFMCVDFYCPFLKLRVFKSLNAFGTNVIPSRCGACFSIFFLARLFEHQSNTHARVMKYRLCHVDKTTHNVGSSTDTVLRWA